MNIIDKLLKESKDNKSIIAIYHEDFSEASIGGFVINYDEDYIFLKCADLNGYFDGFALISKNVIKQIETNGKYENRITKLIKFSDYTNYNEPLLNNKDLLKVSLLSYLFKNKILSDFQLSLDSETNQDDSFFGYLLSNIDNNNMVKINMFDDYGEDDGQTVININYFLNIFWGGKDEKSVEKLIEINKKKKSKSASTPVSREE